MIADVRNPETRRRDFVRRLDQTQTGEMRKEKRRLPTRKSGRSSQSVEKDVVQTDQVLCEEQ